MSTLSDANRKNKRQSSKLLQDKFQLDKKGKKKKKEITVVVAKSWTM